MCRPAEGGVGVELGKASQHLPRSHRPGLGAALHAKRKASRRVGKVK